MTVQPIMRDTLFLQQPSRPATPADTVIINDLRETLIAHQGQALGMAANMIGHAVQVIAVFLGPVPFIMVNPRITAQADAYTAQEGCLSLDGERSTTRYSTITVAFQTADFTARTQAFQGLMAQVIQHEIDHCQGVLI